MRTTRSASPIAALALLLAVPTGSALAQTDFRDDTASSGVSFVHHPGPGTLGMAGGVGWLDFDADGDEDLLLVGGDGNHELYRLDPGAQFVDVTAGSNLVVPDSNTCGLIAADYDQDGLVDVYFTNSGPNQLFRNQGNGTFVDEAGAAGVDGVEWSMSASFADFDLDGDLDLFVGNYIGLLRFPYHVGWPNNLYLNDGAPVAPQFSDQAALLGVDGSGVFGPLQDPSLLAFVGPPPIGEPTAGCTLSVATSDFDEDGDPDLMVGNDFGPFVLTDQLLRNDLNPGTGLVFTDISLASGFDARPLYNMGIHGADYDHDGDWDYYMSNLGDNVLLQNQGGAFQDVVATAGPVEGTNDAGTLLLTSWGTTWGDVDNDGWEDLFVVNGFIPAASFIANEPFSPNHLWMNLGGSGQVGLFERRDPTSSGLADGGVGRGVGLADVNQDGWLDLVVANNGGVFTPAPAILYTNQLAASAPQNGYLQLRLRGRTSNLEGIGARVEARAGKELLKRQVLADPVYVSSGSRVVHFGLGTVATADVVVYWPSGIVQRLPAVPTRTELELREPLVRLQELTGPVRVPGGWRFDARLENPDASAVSAAVYFRFQEAEAALVSRSAAASIPAQSSQVLSVTVPAPAPGARWEMRAYADADGSLDGRRLRGRGAVSPSSPR